MSEQIQLFADQAKKSVPHGLTPDKWIEVYNEKFAELIVRECASVVNSRDDSDTGFWANIIKEHFGVEE